jgi:ComF family protein
MPELVFPSRCVHCGRLGPILCQACIASSSRLDDRVCRICSEPIASASVCGSCAFRPVTLSATVALFAFHGPVRDAVHGLKYDDLRALAPLMGRLMASEPKVAALGFDAVVPVPLHPKKVRRRGYNQAELLAKEISGALGVPMAAQCIRRVIDTPPLARTRSRVEREAGVRDAFVADTPEGVPSRVLLVDDVTTTGSTLRECASALLASGAMQVSAVVFAKEV